ncbi:gluconate 2-dehydrogenase subunit 3 family protein [Hyunsoonleella sp. SJ7]|uniref:Gluconate 2-dehydrogenase subunit 3 family protein n=1 Tax=Hyunsoonleella aquatilis TaxID=2762758 RepID=A0A923H8D7_9FLAO|nr:gluconate 2-dehydrogenase subunit 3 family protein [Hyunsoonleella aquatilis]MBC3758043.1 gluconate 2-dehydrogenase subunit 3 family protein [Hyunsoonleella aquatilis]
MKRRDALKNIGAAIGYTVALPSAFSLLQNCTSEKEKWIPLFFSADEAIVIKNLVDLILPKTDKTPGALDVNVPQFIDLYAHNVYVEEELEEYRLGIDSILKALAIPETGAKDLKYEDYDNLLKKYLKASKEKKQHYIAEENITFEALMNLRNQSVWAYKTSKTIGKDVLAYDPIPAVQKGCISVEEATGGKAWSL